MHVIFSWERDPSSRTTKIKQAEDHIKSIANNGKLVLVALVHEEEAVKSKIFRPEHNTDDELLEMREGVKYDSIYVLPFKEISPACDFCGTNRHVKKVALCEIGERSKLADYSLGTRYYCTACSEIVIT